ncbi:ZYRO0G07480p [Zygosaccharomyces rouxii]|uniref:ZYRO0G07480p n=1 Tax=Zygosaccharomyces rouxii (strain ATCC 2623 / CBS 732 / NBRC 1130 / NCYC 568 / NRRL Y-229) TaxID=559307 RepID=C5DZV3_ZYGRC|nr:uncharacterized protein ZYRO0G07480g [Zygosaccharomyces rouxii]KAH9202384.1 phosphoesterase family-domain-containing protein [Zygosaccharomyces rouxii]CAR29387.1 ZYRO0G07480p [Zygosaccharomyces rouxii]
MQFQFSALAFVALFLFPLGHCATRSFSSYNPDPTDVAKNAATANTTQLTWNVRGRAIDRFVVIWLENTDYNKAAGHPDMKWLAKRGITLDNYWALTHPSQPNYVASVGGDYFALDHDEYVTVPKNVSTIADLLDSKGISWGEYLEDMPYSGYQGFEYLNQKTQANDYVRKHNPLISYESVFLNETRLSLIKNFSQFERDLKDHKLPQYFHITPNMTNDGHDSSIKTAAHWARSWLTPLLKNKHFMKNTLVLLTFDENEIYSTQNQVFTILLGGAVPDHLKGTKDHTFYDHYSLLSSVEANWDLDNLGRNDVNANVFSTIANKTNITNRFVNTTYMVNNHTYNGYFLNSSISLPAPNITAINRNGKPVLQKIKDTWKDVYSSQLSHSYFTPTTTTVSARLTNLATVSASVSS